ncbi:MAG: hypothetical protein U5K72_19800 [Balneolaceae bacterium]|nr:hypothetical protein [Balneolaceae bacterium]
MRIGPEAVDRGRATLIIEGFRKYRGKDDPLRIPDTPVNSTLELAGSFSTSGGSGLYGWLPSIPRRRSEYLLTLPGAVFFRLFQSRISAIHDFTGFFKSYDQKIR